MDVIILAGGLGTRLRDVISDVPKPLAQIQNTPFLDILLSKVKKWEKVNNIILAIGYKAESIIDYYQKKSNVNLKFSIENSPLKTGGAIKKAFSKVESLNVLILNGDSFLDIDFDDFYKNHIQNKTLLSIACTKVENSSRYGQILIDQNNKIIDFLEKNQKNKPGFINGGIYLVKNDLKTFFPKSDVFSFEDFLTNFIKYHDSYSYICNKTFIDIGIKEDYFKAQQLLRKYIYD